jgi:hypothetical protein
MGDLREIFFNRTSDAEAMQTLTDIIEFSVFDVKIRQDDGLPQPVPDGRLEPLALSHDVASVRNSKRRGYYGKNVYSG